MGQLKISGVGCSLGDYVYNHIDFSSAAMQPYVSKTSGDGGLTPGTLVFTQDFEKFSEKNYQQTIKILTEGRNADTFNLGGPGIVSLVHASQMLCNNPAIFQFYGAIGKDETAKQILEIINKTPVSTNKFKTFEEHSPFTHVLSDPQYDNGKGERIFINNTGCASLLSPEDLDSDFYTSDIVCFGGTALVFNIHDHLGTLIRKSSSNGCITIVNTVFDFRNHKNINQAWPLVGDVDYKHIDVLIMDMEEACRISGMSNGTSAMDYFIKKLCNNIIITHGASQVMAYSNGGLFHQIGLYEMPVSQKVGRELSQNPELKGDTTGCGDNFAGGIIASIGMQLGKGRGKLDLEEALVWAVASGGYTCYYMGGTYIEKYKGEKLEKVNQFVGAFQNEQKDSFRRK